MSDPTGDRGTEDRIEGFLGDPTRDLDDWEWLWAGDHEFPTRSDRGPLGRLIVAVKRLLRPFFRAPTADLWDRQRVFNVVLLEQIRERLERAEALEERVGDGESAAHALVIRLDSRALEQDERAAELEDRAERLEKHNETQDERSLKQDKRADRLDHKVRHLENFLKDGLEELMRYSDALYSRVDQKLEQYRHQSAELDHQLSAALAVVNAGGADEIASLRSVVEEKEYRELEAHYRGTETEISERATEYLPLLEGRQRVLDLGCGRGEALALLLSKGIGARGVDRSRDMVRLCTEQGLEAEEDDVLGHLESLEAESLDGVVSFHVIEHLPSNATATLVHLAWRALEPGGVLILETPNPLSVFVAASSFWRDPTHLRPIHPDALKLSFELAGFERVERRLLRPFGANERLPEIDISGLKGQARALAQNINTLRDRLDEILFGYQDYAMIGIKRG